MKSIYYVFLNENQIKNIISDAISNIEISSCNKNDFIDSYLKFVREDYELKLQYFSFINCKIDFSEQLNKENDNIINLMNYFKEKNINFMYYNLGENSIKAYLIEELSKWKRTSKFMKLPIINIRFSGLVDKNLICLITASKYNIDEKIEQKIFETKQEFVNDLNELKINKCCK